MKAAGGPADLDGRERWGSVFGRGERNGETVAEEQSDGSDERVFEVTECIDLDGDGGCVGGDELAGDAEEELVVPGRVFGTDSINSGAQLIGGMNPGKGIGL